MSGTPDVSDVIVVGGGIVGCAIARALAGTNLSVTLLEARDDVGDGTSKANTALLHTGYDASPGTLESRLVARGYELLGGIRGADGYSGRTHRAHCWSRGPTRNATRSLALRRRPNGTSTTAARSSRPTRFIGVCPTSVLACWPG